jgi:hypothetical protein
MIPNTASLRSKPSSTRGSKNPSSMTALRPSELVSSYNVEASEFRAMIVSLTSLLAFPSNYTYYNLYTMLWHPADPDMWLEKQKVGANSK